MQLCGLQEYSRDLRDLVGVGAVCFYRQVASKQLFLSCLPHANYAKKVGKEQHGLSLVVSSANLGSYLLRRTSWGLG